LTEAPRAGQPSISRFYAPALLTVVAAAVRFAALGHQSFWVDETVTAKLLAKSFPGMLAALPDSESTPPLYYVLAWVWSRIFGSGEAALRSLSALAGTLTVPVAFAAGRVLVSRRAGLLVAALATVSPVLVWYSQEARAYALFMFLSALSLLFFGRALDEPSPGALTWWACTSALSLLTHYFAVFLVAGEAAFLLYHHRQRATYLATAAIAAVGVALLPLAAFQATHASSSWIRSLDLRVRIEETLGQLLVPSHPSIWAGAGVPEGAGKWWPFGIVLLGAGAGAALLLSRGRQRRGALASLSVGVVAVAAPIVVSLASASLVSGRGDVFLFRNVVCAWLPLTIVIAAGLAAPRAGRPGVAVAVALCAASLAVLVVNSTTSHFQRDDWRLLARATHGPGRAIVLSPSWEAGGLEYYTRGLSQPATNTSIREIDLLVRRWSPSYSPPVRAFDPPPSFRKVEMRTLQNWVLTVFRAPTAVRVSPEQLENVRPQDASRAVLERLRP
jgi:mannosyltransferase